MQARVRLCVSESPYVDVNLCVLVCILVGCVCSRVWVCVHESLRASIRL